MRVAVLVLLLLLAGLAGCGQPGALAVAAEPQVTGFVKLGPLGGVPSAPVELTGQAPNKRDRVLRVVPAEDLAQAKRALAVPPGKDGTRTFAFLKPGCQETGAEPAISGNTVDVELTGGENVSCAQAVYFLVVLQVVDPQRRLRLPA